MSIEQYYPSRHEPYHCDLIQEGRESMEAFENLSTLNVDFTLEDYKPTDKYLLTIETMTSEIQLVISKEQLTDLREAIKYTSQELEEMNAHKDTQANLEKP